MRPKFERVIFAFLISISQLGQAQTTAAKTVGPMSYDVSEEATISGTIATVLVTPSVGMLSGSHLILTTLSGSVDISLGTSGLRGKDSLTLNQGQQVEVNGVMKTFRGNQVFLARTVKTGDSVYEIRNEHGVPITPRAHSRASQNSQSGDKR